MKADSAAAPLLVLGWDVLGDEVNLAIATDEFVCVRIGCRLSESDIGAAIGRPNLDPSAAIFEGLIHQQPETELVEIETQTALLIPNKDHDEMQ